MTGSRFTYATGRLVLWSRRPDGVDPQGQVLKTGALARLAMANPAAYDFWHWNCENFVNFLVGEEPRSDQIRWLGVAVVALTTMVALSS